MSLNNQEVLHIARLAKLDLSESKQAQMQDELNRLLGLFDDLQSVDTTGIEPLAHPLAILESIPLRLRDDKVTAVSSIEQRDDLMQNAPASHDGLFLVPKVIE